MNEGTENNTKIGWGRLILESLLEGAGEVLEKEPEEEPHMWSGFGRVDPNDPWDIRSMDDQD